MLLNCPFHNPGNYYHSKVMKFSKESSVIAHFEINLLCIIQFKVGQQQRTATDLTHFTQ